MTEINSGNSPDTSASSAASEISPGVAELQETLANFQGFVESFRPGETLKEFYEKYKTLIIFTVGGLILLISFKILLAVLEVINGIPLLSPVFEVIGIGFTVRYTIDSEGRNKLFQGIKDRWDGILGKSA
jgi:hypothetical protein